LESWRCKVSDYDLGFLRDDNPTKFSHSQYYAPEMFSDSFSVSTDADKKAADVWEFGMLMYTLFTYKEPFPNKEGDTDVKNKITKVADGDLLVKLFDNLNSKSLKKLLLDYCCKRAPNERSPSSKIKEAFE